MTAPAHLLSLGARIGQPGANERKGRGREWNIGMLSRTVLKEIGAPGPESHPRLTVEPFHQGMVQVTAARWNAEEIKAWMETEGETRVVKWGTTRSESKQAQTLAETKRAIAVLKIREHGSGSEEATHGWRLVRQDRKAEPRNKWDFAVELQKVRNQKAIELVASWLVADADIETDTWSLLKVELDLDRLSGRGLWHADP